MIYDEAEGDGRPSPSRLEQVIDLEHQLVGLAKAVNWPAIEAGCGGGYADGPGMLPLPTGLMARLQMLKLTFCLSDEELCERWVESPYVQFFCGEEFFRHRLPFDRSRMSR